MLPVSMSAVKAMIPIALGGLCGLSAWAQTADMGLPEPRDLIAPTIQGMISLNGNNAAMNGVFRARSGSPLEGTSIEIQGLSLPVDIPAPQDGAFAQTELRGVFTLLQYQQKSDDPILALPASQRTMAWALSAGVQGYKALGPNGYALGGVQMFGTHIEDELRVAGLSPNSLLAQLLDGRYANYKISTVSLMANAHLGWRGLLCEPLQCSQGDASYFAQVGMLQLWTQTLSTTHPSQAFSRLSGAWRAQAGLEWQPGFSLREKPLVLVASATRYEYAQGAQAFESTYLNEVSLDVLLLGKRRLGQPEGMGLSLAYVDTRSVHGWRLQLKLPL